MAASSGRARTDAIGNHRSGTPSTPTSTCQEMSLTPFAEKLTGPDTFFLAPLLREKCTLNPVLPPVLHHQLARGMDLCHLLPMRLTDQQIQTIRNLVRDGFGPSARVHVFGSRTDETAIGGDIDLLVELTRKAALAQEIALSARIEQQLGEPVDVITTWPGQPSRPIVEIARLTGIPL